MKHVVHFCIRHGLLPGNRRLRRAMLRSIFTPASVRDSDLAGWFDLGPNVSQEDVARFRAWWGNEQRQ